MSKRMHDRVSVHRKVEFQHAQGKGEGMLLDLSLKGCRIRGVYPSSSGTRLRLQLWLPDHSHPVKVDLAAVQWNKENEFGVSFLTMSPDAQARLAQVFRMLHEAQQQPEARTIPIAPYAIGGLKAGISEPQCPQRVLGTNGSPLTAHRRPPHHSWSGTTQAEDLSKERKLWKVARTVRPAHCSTC